MWVVAIIDFVQLFPYIIDLQGNSSGTSSPFYMQIKSVGNVMVAPREHVLDYREHVAILKFKKN
jgi:hypothetical protein